MKLLLDENLSFRILAEIESAFPGSEHVTRVGLQTAEDSTLWRHARDHGFVVVTQNSDFHELAMPPGSPPKIIWLKCGNRPRRYVASLLLKHRDEIDAFGKGANSSVVEIIN